MVESLLALGFAFVVFPKGTFFSYVVKQDGAMPATLLQLILACLVSQCLSVQLTKDTKNPEVLLCTSIANILTRTSLALCTLQGLIFMESLSDVTCLVTLAVLVPLILGDSFHLFDKFFKYHDTIGDPISGYLATDAMATFVSGIIILLFPDIFSHNMGEATGLFVKAFGFMVIGQALLSFGVLCFRDEKDAKAILKAKIIMHALCCIAFASSYVNDPAFWNDSHPYCFISLSGMLLYNAARAFIDDLNS